MKLNVKREMNDAARRFPELAKRLPSLTRDAINATASEATRRAIAIVARETKLPQKYIRNRFDLAGRPKDRRVNIRRASTSRLVAELDVYVRGLPVSTIAGMQLKKPGGGVRAKGGRFYRGAFRHGQQVFKRIGRDRLPLMVPKVGLRERLRKEFDKHVQGPEGQRTFQREYASRINRALSRYGVKA